MITDREQAGWMRTIVAFSTGLRDARITLDMVDPLGEQDGAATLLTHWEGYLKPVEDKAMPISPISRCRCWPPKAEAGFCMPATTPPRNSLPARRMLRTSMRSALMDKPAGSRTPGTMWK